MKVLNLYAGIGGNRKLWTDVEVTAVELNPDIAKIYQDFFPNDKVIVGDAHQYLLEHFKEFEFIWSSPPCPTHSRSRYWGWREKKPIYPDINLYQEIIFLKYYALNQKYIVENVIGYYEPLITPTKISRHYFWSNFFIQDLAMGGEGNITDETNKDLSEKTGFDLSKYDGIEKTKILRNCVEP